MGAEHPQITILPIESIKPYENNAKLHPPEQINQIAASIQAFGNNDPIAVDEDNAIIEGHGRLLALKQLGYKEVEVIRLTHMTPDQKRAYILIHNRLTMNTDFDYNILDAELARINDIDMTDFGFETIEVSPMDYDTDFTLNDSTTPLIRTLSMAFTPEQNAIWRRSIEVAQEEGLPNRSIQVNDDCNAIAEIVRQWSKERGLNAN